MKNIDDMIVEAARVSPMAYAVQSEMDRQHFVEFVKSFALDALHDSTIREKLFEVDSE